MSFSIGFIDNGHVNGAFALSLAGLLYADRDHRRIEQMLRAKGCYLGENRGIVVQRFLQSDADVLVFIDSDVIFTAENAYALVDNVDPVHHPIVTGITPALGDTEVIANWFMRDLDRPDDYVLRPLSLDEVLAGPKISRIDACAAGFLAIHRSALDRMAEKFGNHWFAPITTTTSGAVLLVGEDFSFCLRAAETGIQIYGDKDLLVGHEKLIDLRRVARAK